MYAMPMTASRYCGRVDFAIDEGQAVGAQWAEWCWQVDAAQDDQWADLPGRSAAILLKGSGFAEKQMREHDLRSGLVGRSRFIWQDPAVPLSFVVA